jgi:uncharacterized phage-associated protein
MATVFDVAAYILKKNRKMITHMKLQKLCYYAQAWSLVWDETPLFKQRIEAWSSGPVVRSLYDRLRGHFGVNSRILGAGDPAALTDNQKETIDSILEYYGEKSAQYLSDLTHMEKPWRDARTGIPSAERSEKQITNAAMAEYYGSLQ